MHVYDALYKAAIIGNVQACKEFLDRTEGKVNDKMEVSGTVKPQDIVFNIYGIKPGPETLEQQKKGSERLAREELRRLRVKRKG